MPWVYRFAQAVSILAVFAGALVLSARADELKPAGSNAYQMVTGDDSEGDRRNWDRIFDTGAYVYGKDPSVFLRDHVALLPQGRVLDIAMGEGRNAVFMAQKGFKVEGVDISEVAIRKAKMLAKERKVSIETVNADLQKYEIRPESYEVILNINYLQRSLIPQIKRGLKKGGIVVFENETVDPSRSSGQKVQRDFLLEKGELKELFREFQILVYRETNDGKEARASLIARRTR
jgi:tellurite methyltransferase